MGSTMTDNEIIKALECCDNDKQCTECPMNDSYPFCDDVIGGIALDLINRQKAENSNLTSRLTSLQNDLTSAKAEIERLQKQLNNAEDLVNEKTVYIADLHDEIAALQDSIKQGNTEGVTMAEYIEREALDSFRNEVMDKFIELCRGNDYNKLTLLKIGDTIDFIYEKHSTQPAADVVEVRHAQFEWGYQNGQYGIWCTDCGAGWVDSENAEWIAREHDYCPKCGAKMDGKGENA